MARAWFFGVCCSLATASVSFADVSPLEGDGLRSVLIRGRVIAPVIPPTEEEIPVSAELVVPPARPVIGGPEPTPAIPRPGMILPGMRQPGRPAMNAPFRGAINANPEERVAGDGEKDIAKRDRDSDQDNRPRFGLFRRRR